MASLTEIDTQLKGVDDTTRMAAAKAAVDNTSGDAKKDVAKAAVQALTPQEQADLQKSLWPQNSGDRRAVYLAGFIIAAVVAIALALVSWGAADSGNESVATAVLVAMTGITGAIIGGLFGAYKGQ